MLMSSKRGFLEIIAEITNVLLQQPLKKTHITFRCNLDSRAVTKYLKLMLKSDLIETNGSYYSITQNGINFLNEYKKLIQIIKLEQKDETFSLITEQKSVSSD